LQDSRRLSEPDLPERVGIIHRERVAGSAGARDVCSGCSPTEPCRYEAVRQIERFGSNFQLLHLVNVVRSGQSRIQRPRACASQTVPAPGTYGHVGWKRLTGPSRPQFGPALSSKLHTPDTNKPEVR